MKVTLTREAKKYITLAEAPVVREMIADLKDEEMSPADWAEIAINAVCNFGVCGIEVFKASAKISKNCRAENAYNDHSGNLDVWIEASAFVNDEEFIIIGAYLSDIWHISAVNREEISSNFYIRRFKEAE